MKIKKAICFIVILVILIFLITQTEKANLCVKDSLILCINSVIPSLFPFFVISGLLVKLDFVAVLGKMFLPLSRVLFNQSGKGAVVFLIGLFCGYPTGAKVISDMYKERSLKKDEAERLLAFCNNSGPLFVIGAVGTNMLGNHNLGVALYIIHFLSAVFVGVALRKTKTGKSAAGSCDICSKNISRAISESIESAVGSILNVCGYVVFFSILCAIVKNVFLISLLEVTSGAKALIACGLGVDLTFVLLSGVIGFGGICVLFQVQSAVSDTNLSLKYYIFGKTIQAVTSMVFAFLYVNLFEVKPVFATMNTFDNSTNVVVVMFFMSLLFCLFRLTKKE